MTKITVEKALIEQAIEALACAYISNPTLAALRDALAEPVVEPVAYRSLLASGNYTYCDTDVFLDNAEPLYASPPPPAEVPVPLLTQADIKDFARVIESLVRQKAGLV